MKYIDEFRDRELVKQLLAEIKKISHTPVRLMEVCGGHTMAIHKFGIPALLPPTITLLSGPGCPVCVTSRQFIDQAIAYSRLKDSIITTYGDLIRVPGSNSSLAQEKANGADIRMVYSIIEALNIAKQNRDKKIIFLGIGFETTTPMSAIGIIKAKEENLKNFFLFSCHKIMPPAMAALIDEGVKLDGYIAPGHVSVVTGTDIYNDIPLKYKKAVVISGFEPVDLLQSILMLIRQLEEKNLRVEIQYKRVVKPKGNIRAKEAVNEVFELCDDWWRGLGILKNSALKLTEKYKQFSAIENIPVNVQSSDEPKGCICGEILRGMKSPRECKLFSKACTPENPVGACMVSSEGACAAYYLYNEHE